jgi:hypothetical protein
VEDQSASQATEKGNPRSGAKNFFQNRVSAGAPPESPVVLVKWYDYAKWVLERVESFPKNQKYVLGQRLSNQVMDVLEGLVEAAYSREKRGLLATVNRKMEVVRWTVCMCKDRNLLSAAQFTHSARCLNECGKMVQPKGSVVSEQIKG